MTPMEAPYEISAAILSPNAATCGRGSAACCSHLHSLRHRGAQRARATVAGHAPRRSDARAGNVVWFVLLFLGDVIFPLSSMPTTAPIPVDGIGQRFARRVW
jgi:hypothetical protein